MAISGIGSSPAATSLLTTPPASQNPAQANNANAGANVQQTNLLTQTAQTSSNTNPNAGPAQPFKAPGTGQLVFKSL